MPKQHAIQLGDTECSTWFERDRAHVNLHMKDRPGDTLVEWWDESVQEAVEDGFLKPGKWHEMAYAYWAERFPDDPFLTAEEELMLEYLDKKFMSPYFYQEDFVDGNGREDEESGFPCPVRYYEPQEGDRDVETISGKWWYRLSANGYMDCTGFSGPFDTEIEAVRACIDEHGDWDAEEFAEE